MRLPAYRLRRQILASVILTVAYVIVLGPILFVAVASFDYGARAYVTFPPDQFTLESYWQIPQRYWDALRVSVQLAAVTMIAACAIGIPAAIGVVRSRVPGKRLLLAMFRLPLQIPAVVSGVAFLQAYYAVGDYIGWHGVGSFPGLAIAHTFAATPYVIGTMVTALQRFDESIEEAAVILGASVAGTLRQITLPMLRPGIFAGALYAFMISFAEVPMSVFLTGSNLMTFPVEVFNSMQFDFEPTILAISTLVTIVSLVVVWLAQRIVGLDMFVKVGTAD
jgi:putative spermidine/putrescine transport system permease protein